MSNNNRVVGIFTMPQEFPCGPQASCCGPIGQSDEELEALRSAIAKLGVEVEVHNVNTLGDGEQYQNVRMLLKSFGYGVVPILTVDGEVISIGNPKPEGAASAVKAKIE